MISECGDELLVPRSPAVVGAIEKQRAAGLLHDSAVQHQLGGQVLFPRGCTSWSVSGSQVSLQLSREAKYPLKSEISWRVLTSFPTVFR